MFVGPCHQTAHLLILYMNVVMYAMGFGIPSPIDVHTVCSNLDSIQHLHNHLSTANSFCVNEIIPAKDASDFRDVIGNELRGFYTAVKQATVTKRVDNAVAGILAEAAAGATGALISRKSTIGIARETKKDSLGTKMKSTGAFFGTRIGMEGEINNTSSLIKQGLCLTDLFFLHTRHFSHSWSPKTFRTFTGCYCWLFRLDDG